MKAMDIVRVVNWFRAPTAPSKTSMAMKISAVAMNKAFDASAGHWCDHCHQWGNHSTRKHEDVMEARKSISRKIRP